MQLTIRTFEGNFEFNVLDNSTVTQLKEQIAARLSLPTVDQVLYAAGRPISNDDFLINELGENATIDVSSRLLGGKVHGSLARAGKVRNQTQKVEPQEKKKKKVGRCARRMQYNRSIANIATGPGGRRRGPNSNAPTS